MRPLLAKWHPLLADHEARRDPSVSPVDHERHWAQASELRHEIEATRQVLRDYADILAKVAGIEPLPWPQAEPKADVS
jgi:hypothetical protein